MKWFTTRDEKPKDGERVICLCNHSGRYSVAIYMFSKYFDAWSDGFQHFGYDCVEAWTPMESLINNYKERKND